MLPIRRAWGQGIIAALVGWVQRASHRVKDKLSDDMLLTAFGLPQVKTVSEQFLECNIRGPLRVHAYASKYSKNIRKLFSLIHTQTLSFEFASHPEFWYSHSFSDNEISGDTNIFASP